MKPLSEKLLAAAEHGYAANPGDHSDLLREAAAVLRAVEGAETAYWVPNSRAASDGSYEDGPGSIVMAAEASPYERSLGTPLRLVPLDAAGSVEGVS